MVAYTTYLKEQDEVEVLEFPPGEGSLEEARKVARTNSPIFRLRVTPAVLRDLKDNILSEDEARRQFRKAFPKPSGAPSQPH
jgi:hypothetical protein